MVDVLAQYYQLQGLIKWPNDVIVHGKKICGVLMEALWRGQALQAVILGMGVNLARDAYPPEAALRYPATSLEAETGFAPQPLELLAKLLIMLDQTRKNLVTDDFIHAKNAQLAFQGEWVTLEEKQALPEGCACWKLIRMVAYRWRQKMAAAPKFMRGNSPTALHRVEARSASQQGCVHLLQLSRLHPRP